jgi:hypothetical protein
MKITSISRKITGHSYENVSLTAYLNDDDDPVKCGIELNNKCCDILDGITEHKAFRSERNRKEERMLNKVNALTVAIKKHELDDLPF